MQYRNEKDIENAVTATLSNLNYQELIVQSADDLKSNFIAICLNNEKGPFKDIHLTKDDALLVYEQISQLSQWDCCTLLRDKSFTFKVRGTEHKISFLSENNIDNDIYQFASQFRVFANGIVHSIYDLVIIVNGLPLAHIELKRPTLFNSMKDAVGQLINYVRYDSYELENFIQLLIASNNVETKYWLSFDTNEMMEYEIFDTVHAISQSFHDSSGSTVDEIVDVAELFFEKSNFNKFLLQEIQNKPQTKTINMAA